MTASAPTTALSRRKALTASGLGAVAVLGAAFAATQMKGSTFALWQDTEDIPAATVTSGLLDLRVLRTDAFDVSTDRTDSPHVISLATWRMVPGDTIRIGSGLDIALYGDNLAAEIDMAPVTKALNLTRTIDVDGTATPISRWVSASAYLVAGPASADALGGATLTKIANTKGVYRFQAARQNGTTDKGGVEVPAALDGVPEVTAVVEVTFSKDTPDQVFTEVNLLELAKTGVTLTQVREGTGFES